jgi:hypothetical protein
MPGTLAGVFGCPASLSCAHWDGADADLENFDAVTPRAVTAAFGAAAVPSVVFQEPSMAQEISRPDGRIHYRRFWLNRPGHHGSAHVIAQVEVEHSPDEEVNISASFLIADCARSVTLDFDMWRGYNAADRRNALRKARLLRDAAAEFCAALETADAEFRADRARRREARPGCNGSGRAQA